MTTPGSPPHDEVAAAATVYPWVKDLVTPVLVSSVTAVIGFITARLTLRREEKKDMAEAENRARELAEVERKDRIEADTAQADSMTRRFQALMDGYEARIEDLMDEVQHLRDEVKSLRKALDERPITLKVKPDAPAAPTAPAGN